MPCVGDVAGGLMLDAPAKADAAPPPIGRPAVRGGRWQFWRSPDDQPWWARPALLLVAALAALSYSWGSGSATLETFYGAAVRSMSQSWHDFFFGAFDPWGTVSVDKLPGAFWLQALSVRLFGFHIWAMVLPQAVEGTLTVLVLYRAVRRVAGAGGGLVAAIALAATPVTILLNRGNISDSLLILLLVLAADATTAAVMSGRLQPLVLAGVWVGLAFQAKMLQSWVVLPALYLAYILAAPVASLERRVGHVALSVLAVLAVSLSWMCVVSLIPAHDRPYVDGSCDNSVFSQVFLYNGADRLDGNLLDQTGCSQPPVGQTTSTSGGAPTHALDRGAGRFLDGGFGRDAGLALRARPWSLWGASWWPADGCHAPTPGAPRRCCGDLARPDLELLLPPRAFSTATTSLRWPLRWPHCAGSDSALAWQMARTNPGRARVVTATVAVGVGYAVYLVPEHAGVRPWIIATSALATAAAVGCLVLSLRRERRPWERRTGSAWRRWRSSSAASWASATAVSGEMGPFNAPYQAAADH